MWLLAGGDSEIGAATFRQFARDGRPIRATTRRPSLASAERPFLDLSKPLDDWAPPIGTRSACIFAAVARLSACHSDPAGSSRINVTQTLLLIERLIARDVQVVFLSTNQVFDGATPLVPADAPACPVSEYGRQKTKAEAALRAWIAAGAPIAILRLAKVVSPDMALLHGWMASLAAGHAISAFHDMAMAPVPIGLVSAAIAALLDHRATGVFQLSGARDVSYFDVGRRLAERAQAKPGLVRSVSAYSTGLPEGSTPRHSTLDSSILRDRYGFDIPDPWDVIEAVVAAK
jgi:dTDP-4-dehydrorhamnose reductase